MPRPKVRPEDRRRSSRACVPCKLSKKRCDAQLPCVSCLRRDRALYCVYGDDTASSRTQPVLPRAPRRSRNRSEESNTNTQQTMSVGSVSEHERATLQPVVERPASPGKYLSLENRVLISSKGEKGTFRKLHPSVGDVRGDLANSELQYIVENWLLYHFCSSFGGL